MRPFRTEIEIAASPAQVWTVMQDIERWSEWTPSVTSIQKMSPGPLTVGSCALIRQPKLPPAKWEITSIEDGHSFTWITHSPGVRVTAHHKVEATEEGSRVTLSLQFSGLLGPLVARMTRNLNERYLTLEANGLKEHCEAAFRDSRVAEPSAPVH